MKEMKRKLRRLGFQLMPNRHRRNMAVYFDTTVRETVKNYGGCFRVEPREYTEQR